ncbi:MATE family efflux transporter [Candidatus Margulisiibacteriota bacterium]
MKTSAANKLTEGSIITSLLSLSVPIVFANILHTAYNLTDTFWLGRLGQHAVASVSLSFPIIFLLISLGGGMSIAGSILVAQYKGKGDKHSVDYIAAQTIIVMCFSSVIVSILGFFNADNYMRLLGVETAVYIDSVKYLKIIFLGVLFLFGFFVFQALMRGVGDVKTPVYISLGTVLLNLILDPLFIFGYGFIPPMGVSGAAIATITTQGLATIIGMFILFSGNYGIHLHLKNLKPDIALIKKMYKLGLPASIEQSMRALGLLIMTFLVAGFSTVIIAAYGIGSRILSFIIIPSIGLAMATSTLVGQNIGAGKLERAERIVKISARTSFVVLSVTGLLIFIFARPLAAFFIPRDIGAITYSTAFIRIMALTFGFLGIQHVLCGAFRGSGDTIAAMVMAVISLWLLQFPLAFVLSRFTVLSESGIWWSYPITNVIAAAIVVIYFKKGRWREKKLTEGFTVRGMVTQEVMIEEGVD